MVVELNEYSYLDLELQIYKFSFRDSVDEDIYIRLEECVQLIDDIEKDGGWILVYCVVGVSRFVIVCIVYFVKIY